MLLPAPIGERFWYVDRSTSLILRCSAAPPVHMNAVPVESHDPAFRRASIVRMLLHNRYSGQKLGADSTLNERA
jgi:hypothetical protein